LVVKPMTGVLDLASATADGFKDVVSDKKMQSPGIRRRSPRTFYTHKRIYKVYD